MSAMRFATAVMLLLLLPALCSPATGIDARVSVGPDHALIGQGSTSPEMYVYRNYSEIESALMEIQNEHSSIAHVYDIGDSWEKTAGRADRDILAMKISDNVGSNEDEPQALIVGLQHAREWPTSELVLALAENITDAYGNDSRTSWLVDNREIWLVPVVNPDGLDYALTTDEFWRKNRRENNDHTFGVDLNRNYAGSMNNDSAGDWGGEGASHIPGDDVYCGETPFSEPETMAIRNLVLGHQFQVLIDFHSFGQWVMWPWGFTTNVTQDNADFVRIGYEFAALNGYTPMQAVDLYPTTGDFLDWGYGGEDIYAFCFEVGNDFHPVNTTDVLAIIQNNIPPSLLGIELAGDREERSFQIIHNSVPERNHSVQGFEVCATITADRGVDAGALSVFYSIDGDTWTQVAMSKSLENDTYSATIPAQTPGTVVRYYIVAHDAEGVELMSPRYAPYEFQSFIVKNSATPPIEVIFAPPEIIDGSSDFVVGAVASNLSSGASVIVHLQNVTISSFLNITMTESSPEDYSCIIPAGLTLGYYDIWLTSELGGVTEWSSDVSVTQVLDQTGPSLGSHSVTQLGPTSLLLELNCSDLYGVVQVLVLYRVQGAGSLDTASMMLASGNPQAGNWTVTLTIDGNNPIEYKFQACDSCQYSESPEGEGIFTIAPIPEIPFSSVWMVVAAVAILLVLFSRARRI